MGLSECEVISPADCDTPWPMFSVDRAPFLWTVAAILGFAPISSALPPESKPQEGAGAVTEAATPAVRAGTAPAPRTEGIRSRAQAAPFGLTIAEDGPHLRWHLALRNEGPESALVSADPRLLWFEVRVPGVGGFGAKAKKVRCRLPAPLFPAEVDARSIVQLGPGDTLVHDFDPRLYCFAAGEQWHLVPGAQVTPHFGWDGVDWDEQSPPSPRRGKVAEPGVTPFAVRVPAVPGHPEILADGVHPRAASGAPVVPGRGSPAHSSHHPERVVPDVGHGAQALASGHWFRGVEGTVFALRSSYAVWSSTRLTDATARESEAAKQGSGPHWVLRVGDGSDADFERNGTVRVELQNRADRAQRVYFRRELVHFQVMGPSGLQDCDAPEGEFRAPDRQAFDQVAPGKSLSLTTRLAEFCPRGTFAVPGLYLIHARVKATESGEAFDFNAFVGELTARSVATLRIHKGEEKPRLGGMVVVRARPEPVSGSRDPIPQNPGQNR